MAHIAEQRPPPPAGQHVCCLRLAPDEAFFHRDVSRLFELSQMHARIAVRCPGRVTDRREINAARACEKGDDGEPDAALQNIVYGGMVEISHDWPGVSARGQAPAGTARSEE